MFQELHKPILDSRVNKWYIAAKGLGAVLTNNNEVVMIYIISGFLITFVIIVIIIRKNKL